MHLPWSGCARWFPLVWSCSFSLLQLSRLSQISAPVMLLSLLLLSGYSYIYTSLNGISPEMTLHPLCDTTSLAYSCRCVQSFDTMAQLCHLWNLLIFSYTFALLHFCCCDKTPQPRRLRRKGWFWAYPSRGIGVNQHYNGSYRWKVKAEVSSLTLQTGNWKSLLEMALETSNPPSVTDFLQQGHVPPIIFRTAIKQGSGGGGGDQVFK